MRYEFHTPDSPEANSRQPEEGDEQFPLMFPTDEGGSVTVKMGRKGVISICTCMLMMLRDNRELFMEVQASLLDTK